MANDVREILTDLRYSRGDRRLRLLHDLHDLIDVVNLPAILDEIKTADDPKEAIARLIR